MYQVKIKNVNHNGPGFDLGEVSAIKVVTNEGKENYSGKPEEVFDLRLSEEDKAHLKDWKVSPH